MPHINKNIADSAHEMYVTWPELRRISEKFERVAQMKEKNEKDTQPRHSVSGKHWKLAFSNKF